MNKQITLANLAESTAQEVFDRVTAHLLKQNAKSTYNGNCAYRSHVVDMSNSLSCAAGCLISDEEMKSLIETRGSSINMHSWRALAVDEVLPDVHLCLIGKLQRVHDCWCPEDWKCKLEDVARERGLAFNYHG